MTQLAVVAWTPANRIAKYQDYPTVAEAAAHVARVRGDFPDAFVAVDPGGNFADWLIDPALKTLSLSPLPAPPPVLVPVDAEDVFRMLRAKGALVDADLPPGRRVP